MSYLPQLTQPPLDADELAVHEALKNATVGEPVLVDPDVIRRLNDKALAAVTPALIAIRRREFMQSRDGLLFDHRGQSNG